MNEDGQDHDARLEGMLRRWGSAEAAGEHAGAKPPLPRRRAGGGVWAVLRWAAVAAALLISASLAALRVAEHMRGGGRDRPVAATAPADGAIDQLRADLAATKVLLARACGGLEDAKAKLAGEAQRYRMATQRLAELQTVVASQGKDVAAARRDLAALRQMTGQRQTALKKFQSQLGVFKQEAAAGQKMLADARKERVETLRLLKWSTDKLAQLIDKQKLVDLVSRDTAREMATLKARQGAMLACFQRLHLATAARLDSPRSARPRGGWSARQAAARATGMIRRCAVLRSAVRTQAGIQLMDQLEVILTRLDVLDTRDSGAVKALAAMVREGRAIGQIDQVMAVGKESPEVLAWLLEARLILMQGEGLG